MPFMARWPARIRPGSRLDVPVHHVDLLHTIAAAAGAEVPNDRTLDGVDLIPFINGTADGVPHETLFWREGGHQTVLHRGWKLIRADLPDERWLFDLAADPTEQTNLAATRPAKVAELEAPPAAHNAEQAEPLWPSVMSSPQLVDKHGGQPYVEGDEYIRWPNWAVSIGRHRYPETPADARQSPWLVPIIPDNSGLTRMLERAGSRVTRAAPRARVPGPCVPGPRAFRQSRQSRDGTLC